MFAAVLTTVVVLCQAPPGKPPPFRATAKNPDDAVEVTAGKDDLTVAVRSPSGIGRAEVERTGRAWPKAVALRLHLTGLEHFKVSNGTVVLEAAVTGSGDARTVRVWKDGREDAPLDARSPFYLAVRPPTGDGKPAGRVVPEGGYFEVVLPAALFEGNPGAVTVGWVDFYR